MTKQNKNVTESMPQNVKAQSRTSSKGSSCAKCSANRQKKNSEK